MGRVEGPVQVRRGVRELEPHRRKGDRRRSQVGDGAVAAPELDARQDLEAVGHRPRRNARQRRVRARHAPRQHQAGGARPAQRAARPSGAAVKEGSRRGVGRQSSWSS